MELARKAQVFTTGTISLLAFNDKFNNLKDDTDHHGYIQEVETLFPNMICASMVPGLMEFLTRTGVPPLFNPADNQKLAFGKVMKVVSTQINSRLDAQDNFKAAYSDVMGSFIRCGMSQQELEQEIITEILAGSDTTATAIRSTMLCLMKNEQARKKPLQEIGDGIRAGKISNGPKQVINDSQAKQLP